MSSKFQYKKVMMRYNAIAFLFVASALCVAGKAVYLMTVKKGYWMEVADRVKKDSVVVKPVRGNILSCDGQLLASTLPEYKIYMDFQALHEAGNDSLWQAKEDSVCQGLHRIFPGRSAEEFRSELRRGFQSRHTVTAGRRKGRVERMRHWPLWDRRIDYNTFCAVRELPMFSMTPYQSGFHWEEYKARKLSFGSAAARTIGAMFGAKDQPRYGLELAYDTLLSGKEGTMKRRKVRNRFLDIIDTPAIDGADIVTTIDMSIQDLAERAVVDELKAIDNGKVGVAIVMEVKTGDIKAIVNMERCADGQYREIKNHAVSDLLEPGSVFKPVSLLVALDDGVVDTTYTVDTGKGQWPMYGRVMKDWNWYRGGYGVLTLPQTLWYSSNIGVSRIIDDHYRHNPEKFVDGVYRTGIADSLHLPIPGAATPVIKRPRKNSRGQYTNWSKTKLPWMSIGYETQIPPISVLTFYNAIANGGTMMCPRFVQRVVKNGETVMEFPPEVMRKSIVRHPQALREMQNILEEVVSVGLGKKAGSTSFHVSGKTGTAQISKGSLGYKAGGTNYLVSFAGYFPSEAPKYSCIVCIQTSGPRASGGGMSGVVFHNIAEGIMAQNIRMSASLARDSLSIFAPEVKRGNILAADYVLSHLGIPVNTQWSGTYADGNPIWGRARQEKGAKGVELVRQKMYERGRVPDATGMGARDAVYLLEECGLRVRIEGRGKVVKQSLAPGRPVKRGDVCVLTMR